MGKCFLESFLVCQQRYGYNASSASDLGDAQIGICDAGGSLGDCLNRSIFAALKKTCPHDDSPACAAPKTSSYVGNSIYVQACSGTAGASGSAGGGGGAGAGGASSGDAATDDGMAGHEGVEASSDGVTDGGVGVDASSYDGHSDAGMSTTEGGTSSGTLLGATAVSASGFGSPNNDIFLHTCARLSDGTMACWGNDYYGQQGHGPLATMYHPDGGTVYAAASLFTNSTGPIGMVVAVSVTDDGSCALSSGSVLCTTPTFYPGGLNYSGPVGGPSASAVSIATSTMDSCVLLSDGTVECLAYATPVAVPGLTGATAISATGCAVVGGGAVRCWLDSVGAPFLFTQTPVAANAVAISGGEMGTCVALSGGGVSCFSSVTSTATPVAGVTNAKSIAVGYDHACALLNDGTIECWGKNAKGQLGDGTQTDSPSPVAVHGIAHATAITAGVQYSCAVVDQGGVECWGDNHDGELGDGTTVDSPVPVSVIW
jgi:hypothetical protein